MAVRGFRALPPSLLLGLLGLVVLWCEALVSDASSYESWIDPLTALVFAFQVLMLAGMLELAGRSTRLARLGWRLASLCWLCVLTDYVLRFAVGVPNGFSDAMARLAPLAELVLPFALALAAPARRVAAIAIAVVVVAAQLLSDSSWDVWVSLVFRSAQLVGVIALLAIAAEGASVPDAARAGRSFRSASSALRLCAIAIAAMVLLAAARFAAPQPFDGRPIARIETIVRIAQATALGWFGFALLGASRASVPELGRYRLTIAAALILGCAGMALWYATGSPATPMPLEPATASLVTLYRSGFPLLVGSLIPFALLFAVAHRFAAARLLVALRRQIGRTGSAVLGLLCLAAIGSAACGMGGELGVVGIGGIAASALIAILLTAQQCRALAQAIEGPGIPTAQVIERQHAP